LIGGFGLHLVGWAWRFYSVLFLFGAGGIEGFRFFMIFGWWWLWMMDGWMDIPVAGLRLF